MSQKWMSSGCLKAAPAGGIDHERGIIEGVSVCTAGEAKGHGVNLDSEFIEWVTAEGSGKRSGLKARFGHPNMCSTALGTFIGRFKNFRQEDGQSLADLYLSNEAKDTPHGNLYDYVLGMAENEPDMFGTSIVFTPGRTYQRNEKGEKEFCSEWEADEERPLFVEGKSLHACDTVDEPAANPDGLFSSFSNETIAGQVTEFLDLNPQVWDALQSNPSIIEALGRHGDNMDEFVNRYRSYREQDKELNMSNPNTAEADAAAKALEAEEAEGTEPEAPTPPAEPSEPEPTEPDPEPEEPAESEPEPEPTEDEEPAELSREEFSRIKTAFGADIAASTFEAGGTYESALQLAYDAQAARITELEAQVGEMSATSNGKPAKVIAASGPKSSLFKSTK